MRRRGGCHTSPLAGIDIRAEAEGPGRAGASALKELQVATAEAHKRLTAAMKQEIEAAQETVRLAKLRELRALVDKQAPAAKEQLAETAGKAQNQAKAIGDLLKQTDDAFAQLKDDVADLEKRLG